MPSQVFIQGTRGPQDHYIANTEPTIFISRNHVLSTAVIRTDQHYHHSHCVYHTLYNTCTLQFLFYFNTNPFSNNRLLLERIFLQCLQLENKGPRKDALNKYLDIMLGSY